MNHEAIWDVIYDSSYSKKLSDKMSLDGGSDVPRRELDEGVNCFSPETVELIVHMAVQGLVPNAKFSDSECCLWSRIRYALRKEDIKVGEI